MHFTEDKPSGNYIINKYDEFSVTINSEQFLSSVYLSPYKLIRDLPIKSHEDLSRESLQIILDLRPELVILGTGSKQIFPHPSIIGLFANYNIGLEIMNHSSACRTYTILSAEQRKVGMILILNSDD